MLFKVVNVHDLFQMMARQPCCKEEMRIFSSSSFDKLRMKGVFPPHPEPVEG